MEARNVGEADRAGVVHAWPLELRLSHGPLGRGFMRMVQVNGRVVWIYGWAAFRLKVVVPRRRAQVVAREERRGRVFTPREVWTVHTEGVMVARSWQPPWRRRRSSGIHAPGPRIWMRKRWRARHKSALGNRLEMAGRVMKTYQRHYGSATRFEDAAADLGMDLQTFIAELNNARLLGFNVEARPNEGPPLSGAP